MNNANHLPCDKILETLVLFIDHELPSEPEYQSYLNHFQECPECYEEMLHESTAIAFLKELLQMNCNEQAPQELHDRILQQTEALAGQSQVQFFSSTTVTNFTFDGTTSIQVTQEFTQEIRHDFNEEQ
jgi:anti-sigma factor (TIGR02949 family)